ncbi:hypothetical protein ACFO1B_55230 [Dactylosporangium siamense]|nr:hypothetical protein [Dactylosporangium siamense]
MSPPVSAPPPAQPPTTSLHYGHYGPDGQGWPSSVNQPETSQSFPATGTSAGAGTGFGAGTLAPHDSGPINGGSINGGQASGVINGAQPTAPSGGTVYGAAASASAQGRDDAVQPTSGGYGPPPSALDRLSGQPAPVDPDVRVHGDSGQPPYGAFPDPAWGYDTRSRSGAYQEQGNGAARLDAPADGYQEQFPPQDQYPQQGYQAQPYPSQEYPQQAYQSQEYPRQQGYQPQQDAHQGQAAYRPQDGYGAYAQPDNGYQPYEQQPQPYEQQPQPYEQQPAGPEFDWAAPQHDPAQAAQPAAAAPQAPPTVPQLPTQRMPEDDPLVGPLPTELLGNATPLSAAEPTMPTFASEPPYAQDVPAEAAYAGPAYAEPTYAEPAYAEPAYPDFGAAEIDYDAPELPQRVPSHPDVPQVPEVEVEPLVAEAGPAGGAELARIATFLREDREDEDDEPSLDDRPDGFDIPAVLRAVQGVAGVREATLRKNADGLHTLRLELFDEADPGRVSRAVARLLNERMGLAAEPNLGDLTTPAQRLAGPPARGNAPHSALPGYGREARRRRPVSGVRRPAEAPRPDLDELRPPPGLVPGPEAAPGAQASPVAPSVEPGSGPKPPGGRLTGVVTGQLSGPAAAPTSSPMFGPQPPVPVNRDSPPALVPQSSSIVSPRVIIDQVEVSTQGVDAVVEVRLIADGHPAVGVASGPAVDGYILRLSAAAAASAVDQLLVDVDATARARCYIEHAAVVQLGGCEVAVVVLLLLYDGWVEQLTGSSVNAGDPRQAVVRATLAAVNRRLEALLP